LYRGKVLFQPGEVDEDMLAAAARRVGNYLVGIQDQEGCYRVGGEPGRLRDHLLAAYAMAKLARRVGQGPVSASAAKAVDFAMQSVKTNEDVAYVGTANPDEQMGATAMLLLARRRLRGDGRAQEIDGKLLAGLRAGITQDNQFRARLDEPGGKIAAGADAFLAYAAVWMGVHSKQEREKLLKPVREKLAVSEIATAEDALWAAWAGISLERVIRPVRRDGDVPPDEVGGFAEPSGGSAPTTLLTALMLQAGPRFNASGQPEPTEANRIAGHQAAARLFCYQMMYKPREAYFADQPAAWVGGVRHAPDSSRITLEACAGAIEALLED
jgi:hypothetical protein